MARVLLLLSLISCLLCFSCAQAPRNGFNMGLSINSNVSVSNGVVTSYYQAPNFTASIDKYSAWILFYISLSNVYGAASNQEYAATITNSNSTLYTPVIKQNAKGKVTTSRDIVLEIFIKCKATGSDVLNLNIAVTGFQSLSLFMSKDCSNSLKNHDALAIATHTPFGNPTGDVAANGVTNDKWDAAEPGNNQVYGTDGTTNSFWMWLNAGTTSPAQLYVAAVLYDQVVFSSVQITTGGYGFISQPLLSQPVAKLDVQYVCAPGVGGNGLVNVELVIEPYDPIDFTWYKSCPGQPTSAWSPFGIFCFVTFLVVTVACMAGCVFNYVKKHQRGWDILPFIDTYRAIYDRCCNRGQSSFNAVGKSTVGPQAQFDAPIHEPSHTAGTNSYGSYQSI